MVLSVFDDDTFNRLLYEKKREFVSFYKNFYKSSDQDFKFIFNSFGSDLLSVLLNLIDVDCHEKYILDVGARSLMSKTSNTSPIVMKENLTGIFIDADYDRCQNMIKESEIIGINGRSVVLNAHICWHGEDLAYRLNDVFISLDFALELCGVSWENIVCVDLDIDGGEIFLLEDSKGLAKYKPPVIMLEFKKMHFWLLACCAQRY